jgi:CO/xanthine dehydrogenase FAD-binding subunit
LLREAIAHVAHPAIRNRGTIGGSLAHADPASELPACMLALARPSSFAAGGERRIAAEDFFTGIYETALSPQELLVAVELPVAQGKIPRISFTNSPGGTATTPLSACGAGDSWKATSPIFASASLPSAIGRLAEAAAN